MKVSIQQLRAVSDILFSHLEAGGHAAVELQQDFYWHIPKDSAYDLQNEPTKHDVGSLTDEWGFLQKLLEPDPEPVAYGLVWFSEILKAIGEQIVS